MTTIEYRTYRHTSKGLFESVYLYFYKGVGLTSGAPPHNHPQHSNGSYMYMHIYIVGKILLCARLSPYPRGWFSLETPPPWHVTICMAWRTGKWQREHDIYNMVCLWFPHDLFINFNVFHLSDTILSPNTVLKSHSSSFTHYPDHAICFGPPVPILGGLMYIHFHVHPFPRVCDNKCTFICWELIIL